MSWDTNTSRVAPADAVTTVSENENGEAVEEAEAEPPRADKPILVFIEDPEDEDENQKIAKIVFDNNKVIIGAKFFKCIRMSAADAEADPILSEAGRTLPRLVLLKPDYDVGKVVQGKISASKVYSAMKSVASKSYKGNFDRQVKALLKLPNDFDSVNDQIKVLKAKEERGVKPAEAKKIAKELEELAEEQKELDARKEELLKLELKTA